MLQHTKNCTPKKLINRKVQTISAEISSKYSAQKAIPTQNIYTELKGNDINTGTAKRAC